jgi:hypothetical protein
VLGVVQLARGNVFPDKIAAEPHLDRAEVDRLLGDLAAHPRSSSSLAK